MNQMLRMLLFKINISIHVFSDFVFVEEHVRDSIRYGELSAGFRTNEISFHEFHFEKNVVKQA